MQFTTLLTLLASAAFTTAAVTPAKPASDDGITCTPGEYMCVMYAKDWAGPDEIWTCNSQSKLILSAICGGRLCCEDSGSGVKCMC